MNTEYKVVNVPSVVIIGNGVAGSQLAAALNKLKKYDITVVTPFPYQEVPINLSSVVAAGPEAHKSSLFANVQEDNVKYVVGMCTELTPGSVTVNSTEKIPFEVCIVCVGQKMSIFYPDPVTESTMDLRKSKITEAHEAIKHANSIVISGGGAIGVETAADIKLRFKEKEVTVVHPYSQVLNRMSAPFPPLAMRELEKMGIKIILNDRVVKSENGKVELKSGSILSCDYYLAAAATGGNGSFLPANAVDSKGYVKVTNTLEVENMPGVFAFGDCSAAVTNKGFGFIADQMPTILTNIDLYVQQSHKSNPATTTQGNNNSSNNNNTTGLKVYVKGFAGSFSGPAAVALGHHVDGAYGLGPDMPNCCCTTFCWCCCFCGPPCSTPAGPGVAKQKADFNKTVMPTKGKGMSR